MKPMPMLANYGNGEIKPLNWPGCAFPLTEAMLLAWSKLGNDQIVEAWERLYDTLYSEFELKVGNK